MSRYGIKLFAVGALLTATALFSVGVGAVPLAPGRVFQILTSPRSELSLSPDTTIVWQLRVPRVLLACIIGAGLGAAGAGYQGLFRNPLADPFVIGASSGAALGATLAIVGGWQNHVLGLASVSMAALAGSLIAVTIVCGIASTSARLPISSLLLAGVAVSSLFGALVSLLMFLQDEKLLTIFGWLMGSLSGRSWPTLTVAAPIIVTGGMGLWLLSRGLDALTFGEEAAASLGLNPRRLAALVVLFATTATAASVAAAGIIGFVGLIAPHAARFLFGAQHARMIPASALLGAFLLLIADDVARVIAAPAELPVGVITALLGSPFFLVLLKTRQRDAGTADDSA